MMGKNLNYAYPRKFAEGGDVPRYTEAEHAAAQQAAQQAILEAAGPEAEYRRPGVEFVEHNGKMVPADALRALQGAVGLHGDRDSAENLRYDVNGDGRLTAHDASQFLKYGMLQDYSDNADFFSSFYDTNSAPGLTFGGGGGGSGDGRPDSTVYNPDQITSVTQGSLGFSGNPEHFSTTPAPTPPDYTVPFTPTFTTPPTATPTAQTTPQLPPTATMPDLGLSMGNVAGAFTDNPPSPTAGQDAYQQYVVATNPQIASLYTPPEQQGLGSLMDNPLLQSSTNPYLQSSAPTQSVFQRPPGG